MGTPARVAAFLVGLAAVFVLALGAGSLWGPTVGTPAHDDADDHTAGFAGGHGGSASDLPGGLMRSQDGYTLDLAAATGRPGADVPLSLTVTGPDGRPVTAYDVEHEKRLHLIVVRRDLTGFQHVHPTLDRTDGTWSTTVDLVPGSWRVLADFRVTGGPALTLGIDLTVPGEVAAPEPLGHVTTADVDGYTVELVGDLVAGQDAELALHVSRDGRPVTDLQPYLGAYGHLVALREGDLAYLHVHPHEGGTAGPTVEFTAEVPSAGQYRLFLDFRHEDEVHTAVFDIAAEGAGSP